MVDRAKTCLWLIADRSKILGINFNHSHSKEVWKLLLTSRILIVLNQP
ncbi:hypothetical protein [Dapis sp. BLCC M229]